jgi:RCC1 and BTB domain-containing protein
VLVTKNGEVYSCGSFLHGKLGLPSQGVINVSRFVKVKMPVRVKQVACGDYHTLSLTEDGKVYAWGGSLHKKTADASGSEKSEPRLV